MTTSYRQGIKLYIFFPQHFILKQFFSIRPYFLEQFKTQSKIEEKIKRFSIYLLSHTLKIQICRKLKELVKPVYSTPRFYSYFVTFFNHTSIHLSLHLIFWCIAKYTLFLNTSGCILLTRVQHLFTVPFVFCVTFCVPSTW